LSLGIIKQIKGAVWYKVFFVDFDVAHIAAISFGDSLYTGESFLSHSVTAASTQL